MDNNDDQVDVLKAFTNLQDALASKEKSLKEREEAFEKKARLFERDHPEEANSGDVIHLNVGGSTQVAVLRRTLTHFEHSMLASKFSGRWDDSLEKDKDGLFFIDEDPERFMKLIDYLRMMDKRKRLDVDIPAPSATYDFCWMLEYYDLMLSIYPHQWKLEWGANAKMTVPPTPNDQFLIETGHLMCAFSMDLDINGDQKPDNASSLTVVFEKGSVGQIGWVYASANGVKAGKSSPSLALDFEEKCWLENGNVIATNVNVSTQEDAVTVCCTFNRKTKIYAVEVVGSDPKIYQERMIIKRGMKPHLSMIGKASISNLSYSY